MQVIYSNCEGTKKLSLYMTGSFEFKKAKIDNVLCAIMELKSDFPTLQALKKQIKRIQDIEAVSVVIKVPAMSVFRRKNMIEAHIPFIITEEQA